MARYLTFATSRVTSNDATDSLAVSLRPADGYDGELDHTWGTVTAAGSNKKYYFDIAGGHYNDRKTKNNIVVTKGSLLRVIEFATGQPVSNQQSLKDVYGHDRVDGVETFGVRASGYRNWDGQCHQMANRFLYAGFPPKTLDEANPIPEAYGLSVLAWGLYGQGFAEWCERNHFEPPHSTTAETVTDLVTRHVPASKVRSVLSKVIDLQNWHDDASWRPDKIDVITGDLLLL